MTGLHGDATLRDRVRRPRPTDLRGAVGLRAGQAGPAEHRLLLAAGEEQDLRHPAPPGRARACSLLAGGPGWAAGQEALPDHGERRGVAEDLARLRGARVPDDPRRSPREAVLRRTRRGRGATGAAPGAQARSGAEEIG